jgi:hypothetical protein
MPRLSEIASIAGLVGDFQAPQTWKHLRRMPHDHHPVHDAQGKAEAFARLLAGSDAASTTSPKGKHLPAG